MTSLVQVKTCLSWKFNWICILQIVRHFVKVWLCSLSAYVCTHTYLGLPLPAVFEKSTVEARCALFDTGMYNGIFSTKYAQSWHMRASCTSLQSHYLFIGQHPYLTRFKNNKYFVRHHLWLCINPWDSYQIRKIAGCACIWNAGNVFSATNFRGNR